MSRHLQNILLLDSTKLAAALTLDASSARIEVQSLLQDTLNVSRAYLLAHPERCLNDFEQNRYDTLLQRRLNGEPIAYILGKREFFGLMFKVTPATLIPRPETELLVELALQRIPFPCLSVTTHHKQEKNWGEKAGFRVLDLGTGCGAIALSIAHTRPDVDVVAVESSAEALIIARENAQLLNIGNAALIQSDWYTALDAQRFNLIVSNPPYIAADDLHLRQGDLRFEPSSALASGVDGLNDILQIVTKAPVHLQPGGWLLLEHGYDQAEQVRNVMQQAGFCDVFSAVDLAGIERVSGGHV